jgi:hypothetical protein
MSTTLEHLEELGLPPLPGSDAPQRAGGATMNARAQTREREREKAISAAKYALRAAKGNARRARGGGASAREKSAATAAVTGLLKQYAPEELDRLLLDCDADERHFLLGCLVK